MALATDNRRRVGMAAPAVSVTSSAVAPLKIWAALGTVFLVFQTYLYSAWVLSGHAHRTPPGATPAPSWMTNLVTGWQVGAVFAFVMFMYVVLVRPYRRVGWVSLDGLIAIVFLTMFWQDPLMNMFQTQTTYNAHFFNLGAWTAGIPGWLSPRGERLAEPLLWTLPLYVVYIGGVLLAGCTIMRKAKTRWPHLSPLGVVAICAGIFIVADFVTEPLFLRMGLYMYVAGIPWATVFHGHYYQFPIYEGLAAALLLWTPMACLRHFRDDRGHTLAERGIDVIGVSGWKRSGLRFLALVGAFNALMLIYSVFMVLVGLYAGPWPHDVQTRSYMTDGICGPGTTYACSGPGRPINRPDSVHVGPNGELVVPAGTRLPAPAP